MFAMAYTEAYQANGKEEYRKTAQKIITYVLCDMIALAVAHTIQCSYCIDAYTQACLEKGSNLSEMTEAAHVAAAIRGFPYSRDSDA